MHFSIVVASKNRPELLQRMIASLAPQLRECGAPYELIVVDDGSNPPYESDLVPEARIIRANGGGPARARNKGIQASTGDVVFFVDDDVVVHEEWLQVALRFLRERPDHAGVTGDTSSPEYDPLFEHSVHDHVGGSFLTCNIAYRRDALIAVGGFDLLFSHAHEDRDLAWRVESEIGPIGFEPSMRVTHPGRPFTARACWQRANFIYDDWLLFARYPDRRAGNRSIRWTPLANTIRTWRNVFRTGRLWRHPTKVLRWVVLAGGQTLSCASLAVTKWRDLCDRDVRPVPGLHHDRRRIAYVGPSPHPSAGGAPGVAGLILDQLLQRGYSVDAFVAASREDDDPRGLGTRSGLTYVIGQSGFAFGRWYSRHRLTKMLSSQVFAGFNRRRLSKKLGGLHLASPYDFVYQFSTFESFGVPRRNRPPLLIHPSVHAAGERRWTKSEGRLGLSNDGWFRRTIVTTWLGIRSRRQRHDANLATGILALSEAFAAEIVADYGVSHERIRVVPNCIDMTSIARVDPRSRDLQVVGRIAVRKGLQDVAALSHQLDGIAPDLRLKIIGSPSLWSDYRRAFSDADLGVTVIEGSRSRDQVFEEVGGSLALLQLSRYEPFGLTVAEALALGVPVIVTKAVGAAEHLAPDVKIEVTAGSIDELVDAVRSLAALRNDERTLLSFRCRREAEIHFSPEVVTNELEEAIDQLITQTL